MNPEIIIGSPLACVLLGGKIIDYKIVDGKLILIIDTPRQYYEIEAKLHEQHDRLDGLEWGAGGT